MENQIANAYPMPELSNRARWALVSCGLWLRIGFVGASGLAAALLQLLNGEMKPLSALALAATAGTLLAVAWWRARAVLDVADEAVVATSAGSLSPKTAIAASVV
jgi:hypothetical protein